MYELRGVPAMTSYSLAERFEAPQGEGLYSGTPMKFARLVGCSVGKGVCEACDTDFDRVRADCGGGSFTAAELAEWAGAYRHVCLTGGEPLDRDVREIWTALAAKGILCHVETSGTRQPKWLDPVPQPRKPGIHQLGCMTEAGVTEWRMLPLWVTVSPKPGFLPGMVERVADEVKVVLGGLGSGAGWPTAADAVRWADAGLLVYVQPRNEYDAVDRTALNEALEIVTRHPQLRLSCQLHKFLGVR